MALPGFQEMNFPGGSTTSLSNSSAPVVFVEALHHQVNEHDVQALIQSQKHMLIRFEKTNEMLMNCNALLAARYGDASKELKKHIQFLSEMKKDLDSVFRRIRFLKAKLSQQYPSAFSACNKPLKAFDEEEEEKDEKCDHKVTENNTLNVGTAISSSGSRASSPSPLTSPSTSDTS